MKRGKGVASASLVHMLIRLTGGNGRDSRKRMGMADDRGGLDGLMDEMISAPRRDNSAYHSAIAELRRLVRAAETEIGGPIRMTVSSKRKKSGKHVIKFTVEAER